MTIPNLEVLPGGSFALGAPTYVDNYVLAAGTAQTVAVPIGATVALFSANGDFYANYTGTAAVPSGNVTGGLGQELNPTVRYIARASEISLVSAAAVIVSIAWYQAL